MRNIIEQALQQAINTLINEGKWPKELSYTLHIERTKQKDHGDFATNLALSLSKQLKQAPRAIAEQIIAALPSEAQITKTEIAGPGFINFWLNEQAIHAVIPTIFEQQEKFGHSQIGNGKKILLEFVSSNPTGPLHVGHGRGAAYGAALAQLLKAAGFTVHSEYYVNDAGRQMDIIAVSVWLRYLQHLGAELSFPSNGYQGDYVSTIAETLVATVDKQYLQDSAKLFENVPQDLQDDGSGDKEAHIDAIINNAKTLLGDEAFLTILNTALDYILASMREDLTNFRVDFDEWFSERSLLDSGAIAHTVEVLKQKDLVYERDGALWFKATDFGDEKDRVVIRENGQHTYFGADIAYHLNKLERGYDQLIDIWGADHHGYVARIRAVMQALTGQHEKFKALLVQFAILYRGKERLKMSTRSGSYVTLHELCDEVGNDAARFFYVLRKAEQHMDFDLELAKSQSQDNPVYYVQYAHARICSVMRQMQEQDKAWDKDQGLAQLSLLTTSHEEDLINLLNRYPELIENSALNYEPHAIAHYLRELANALHSYYNAEKFLIDDQDLMQARITLIQAVRQVIVNGLNLLGVSAPETM